VLVIIPKQRFLSKGGIEMKRFAAFVTAALLVVCFTVPCFADGTPPKPPDVKTDQEITI